MKKPCKVIALLTDFGYEDPYVAVMKGVALDICPDVKIVDISHSIKSFDIEEAAFKLLISYKYFPQGTIFVVVVDPGVGSERLPLLIVTRNYYFVGPDNGVLMAAAEDDGIKTVIKLENELYFRKPVSASFHGRDIFTPVAAWLACGVKPEAFGSHHPIESVKKAPISFSMTVPTPGCIELRVLHIDKFGNVMLSQHFSAVAKTIGVSIGEEVTVFSSRGAFRAVVEKVFSVAEEGKLVLYENSFGLAELAINKGSAKDLLGVKSGDIVKVCK